MHPDFRTPKLLSSRQHAGLLTRRENDYSPDCELHLHEFCLGHSPSPVLALIATHSSGLTCRFRRPLPREERFGPSQGYLVRSNRVDAAKPLRVCSSIPPIRWNPLSGGDTNSNETKRSVSAPSVEVFSVLLLRRQRRTVEIRRHEHLIPIR